MLNRGRRQGKGATRPCHAPFRLEFESSTGKDDIDLRLRKIYIISEKISPVAHFFHFYLVFIYF